ncbi:hypothetical protein ScPMuIL_017712 [Solemya velum]
MNWRRVFAFLSKSALMGCVGAGLVYVIGRGNCNTTTWQDELRMYICHQKRLETCLQSAGEFYVGAEVLVEWARFSPFLTQLTLILVLDVRTAFSKIWRMAHRVFDMLSVKPKKRPTVQSPSAVAGDFVDVQIAFDNSAVQNLMRDAGGKDVEIVLDYEVILELIKYIDDEDIEVVVDF